VNNVNYADNYRAGRGGTGGIGEEDGGDLGGAGVGRDDFRTSHDGADSFGVSTRSRTPEACCPQTCGAVLDDGPSSRV
jgi:hypothetical protein